LELLTLLINIPSRRRRRNQERVAVQLRANARERGGMVR
jgi:hypothetical protein